MIDEPTKNNVNNSVKNDLFIYFFISSICQNITYDKILV